MEIRKNKDGVLSYREKVYLKNGNVISKTFSRKTDAIAWKQQVETEKRRNESLGIESLKDNILFSELAEIWFERKIKSVRVTKTACDYKSALNGHLKPFLEKVRIRSIERSHADKLIQVLKAKKLSNKTANKSLGIFKQIMSFAELEGYLVKNPLIRFPALKETPGRIDFLSRQEVLQLLRSNAHDDTYPLLLVALNTGMRIGELTGLCWDRVNFENNYIEVSRMLTRVGLVNTTKTNLIRYIPMNVEVLACIQGLIGSQRNPQFVFTNQKGHPYNPDHFSQRRFQKALEVAGVRKVNFHVLRHTYASHFMMNGGNIYDLQKILGHTKVEMTMKYAHLSPQHMQKAVATVRFSATLEEELSPILAPQEKEGLRLKIL